MRISFVPSSADVSTTDYNGEAIVVQASAFKYNRRTSTTYISSRSPYMRNVLIAEGTVVIIITNVNCPTQQTTGQFEFFDDLQLSAVISAGSVAEGPSSGDTSVLLDVTNLPSSVRSAVELGVKFGVASGTVNIVFPQKESSDVRQVKVTSPEVDLGEQKQASQDCVLYVVQDGEEQGASFVFAFIADEAAVLKSATPDMGTVYGGTRVKVSILKFPILSSPMGVTIDFGDVRIEASQIAIMQSNIDETILGFATPRVTSAAFVDVQLTPSANPSKQVTFSFEVQAAQTPTIASIFPRKGPSTGDTTVTVKLDNPPPLVGPDDIIVLQVGRQTVEVDQVIRATATAITFQFRTPAVSMEGSVMITASIASADPSLAATTEAFAYEAALPKLGRIAPQSCTTNGCTVIITIRNYNAERTDWTVSLDGATISLAGMATSDAVLSGKTYLMLAIPAVTQVCAHQPLLINLCLPHR